MTISFNGTIRDAHATTVVTNAGTNAYIRIYSGTRPANPGTALSGNTLLAELRGNATQFGTVSGGVVTLSATTAATTGVVAGTASWFRVYASNGTTAVLDGTAGTSGTDLILNTAAITAGGTVTITSGSITVSPD